MLFAVASSIYSSKVLVEKEQANLNFAFNTLRLILESGAWFEFTLQLLFIHFEKAFDRVNREYTWNALFRRNIQEKRISVIGTTYGDAWVG